MQVMISGLVNKQGIIANYKKSLNFMIRDNTLTLQSGAALASSGAYIDLNETSYTLYENISLELFENKEHYYFYLHKGRVLKDDSSSYTLHTQIAQGIHFIINEKEDKSMILLGEVTIDLNVENNGLFIAKNACAPQVNEIDMRQRNSILLQDKMMSDNECHWFSEALYDLALTLHTKIEKEQCWELSTLSSAFFSFYEVVETSNLNYIELYSKCQHNSKLFSWITSSLWGEESKKHLKLLKTQVFLEPHTFSCDLYAIDKDKEDGFFHCYIKHIKNLTKSLKQNVKSEYNDKDTKKLIALSKDISKTDNYAFEAVLPSSFMIEDENVELYNAPPIDIEPSHDEHDDTVLVGGNHSSKQSIQIGRSNTSGNDIILGKDDISISRVHAKLSIHEQGFFIEDFSSQGTYVDGVRIEKNTKKFVTTKNQIILGKKGYVLDLTQNELKVLLG